MRSITLPFWRSKSPFIPSRASGGADALAMIGRDLLATLAGHRATLDRLRNAGDALRLEKFRAGKNLRLANEIGRAVRLVDSVLINIDRADGLIDVAETLQQTRKESCT